MPHYRLKAEYKPEPCPVCGSPGVVIQWNEIRLGPETMYTPVKTQCSAHCSTTMPLEEWNRRNAEGLKRREENK